MTIKLNKSSNLQQREGTVQNNQSFSVVPIVVLAIVSLFVGAVPAMATTYYVDSVNGSDSNNGTTTMTPWKTLSQASNPMTPQGQPIILLPGDTVALLCGDVWSAEQLKPVYQGASGSPITYTSYYITQQPQQPEVGAGCSANTALPSFSPQGMSEGDPAAAIDVENLSNLSFSYISITNPRKMSRSGVEDKTAYGILFQNTGSETMTNFDINYVTVSDVYSIKLDKTNDADDLQASIGFIDHAGNSGPITNITVENTTINNGTRFGVLAYNPTLYPAFAQVIQNIIVRKVTCNQTGGSCFMAHQAKNVLIENSTFTNTGSTVSNDGSQGPMMGKGSGGWVIDSQNVVVAYNRITGATGNTDSSWFHTDNNNTNVLVEYNFGNDCEGAGIEILAGNTNIIYRYNVSIDNGFRTSPPAWLAGMVSITATGGGESNGNPSTNVYVYGNTFVYSHNSQQIEFTEQMTGSYMYNNIFSDPVGTDIIPTTIPNGLGESPGNTITNNLFNGAATAVVGLDATMKTGAPDFVGGPKNDPNSFKLASGSVALNTGVTETDPGFPALGTGMFAAYPTTPTVDYYGNPLNSMTVPPYNIGADQKH